MRWLGGNHESMAIKGVKTISTDIDLKRRRKKKWPLFCSCHSEMYFLEGGLVTDLKLFRVRCITPGLIDTYYLTRNYYQYRTQLTEMKSRHLFLSRPTPFTTRGRINLNKAWGHSSNCSRLWTQQNSSCITFLAIYETYTMMAPLNGNIFRVTGHLCGEFTGPRWIPRTKASVAELWCFLWSAPEWTVE